MFNVNAKEFGKRLKNAIKEANTTQKDLAIQIGVSKTAINNYVGGRIPNTPILFTISKSLNVTMEWLLSGEDLSNSNLQSNDTLNRDEQEILRLYRKLSDRDKIKIEGLLESKVQESNNNKKGLSFNYHNGDEVATLDKMHA